MPAKVPIVGVPVPISKFTKPKSLVVSEKVSWYTIVPPAVISWMLIRTPTAWFCRISPKLSLTTAWYLKAWGGCAFKIIAQNKTDADIRADKLRNKLKRISRR